MENKVTLYIATHNTTVRNTLVKLEGILLLMIYKNTTMVQDTTGIITLINTVMTLPWRYTRYVH
jgi:hypothetical protein